MSATAAKLAANRANSTHSTGPADTSRTRFNGVAHGLTSKQTVVRGEDQQEFDTFHAGMLRDLYPSTSVEKVLAERIIAAAWRLKRFSRVESSFFNNRIDAYLEENPHSDPDSAMANLFIDPAETARMRLFLRYQTAVQREYDTAVREFQKSKAEQVSNSLENAYRDTLLASAPKRPQDSAPVTGKPKVMAVGFASQTPEFSKAQLDETRQVL
jgi:hypothetical protein